MTTPKDSLTQRNGEANEDQSRDPGNAEAHSREEYPMSATTTATLLQDAEKAAKKSPWGPGTSALDFIRATLDKDTEALERHKAAAEASQKWGAYQSQLKYLDTQAKAAVADLRSAALSGDVTPAEYRGLASEAVTARHVAEIAPRIMYGIPTPAWYQEPTSALSASVSERRLKNAKLAERLLVEARLAAGQQGSGVTTAVALVIHETPVPISQLQKWTQPLIKLRRERETLLAQGPRSGESESRFADRIANDLNRLNRLIDTDDDLLESKASAV